MGHTQSDVNSSKVCPRCGESNVSATTLCWSCYGDFSPETFGKHVTENFTRAVQWLYNRLERIQDNTFVWGLALLILSGWMSSDRFNVLFAGMGFWGLAFICWLIRTGVPRRRRKNRLRYFGKIRSSGVLDLDGADDLPGDESTLRIANTILLYAVRDGMETIRLTADVHLVDVEYCSQGTWHEQMKLPGWFWPELKMMLKWLGNDATSKDCHHGTDRTLFYILHSVTQSSALEPRFFRIKSDGKFYLVHLEEEPQTHVDRYLLFVKELQSED